MDKLCMCVYMISHCPVVFAGVLKSLPFSTKVFTGVGLCAGPPETVEQVKKTEAISK